MKLYLLRHAHSQDGARMDASRKLTAKGKKQCAAIKTFTEELGVSFDVVLSSPFRRAVDTVKGIIGRGPDAEITELEPDATVEQAWRAIMFHVEHSDHVLICTHSPLIHELLSSCCFVFNGRHVFSHGSMCHVDTGPERDSDEENDSGFRWFVRPHLIEKMEESRRADMLASECVKLSEHLLTAGRRQVLDPLIANIQQAVAQRFRRQLKAVQSAARAGVLRSGVVATAVRDQKLELAYGRAAKKAYLAGAKTAQSQLPQVREAKPQPLPFLPGPNRTAPDMETQIDETTDSKIETIVSNGLAVGLSTEAILELVREQFSDWATGARAEAIAANEISIAYHQGMTDYVQTWVGGNGPVEKAWSAQPDACEECAPNEEDGWIDSEAPFSSGDFTAPVHPNCRCSIEYRAAVPG